MIDIFWSIDLPAFIIAALAGLNCGLCGAILFLKRQTMIADALSHSVLPGLALAYFAVGSISFAGMLGGAFAACLLAAGVIFLIKRTGILNEGTALGVTLTGFFALGVVLLESMVGKDVHLDTEHALYGALELVYWPDMPNPASMPHQIPVLALLSLLVMGFIVVTHHKLKMALFDPEWAKATGYSAHILDAIILIITVSVAVSSFEAVGVILVLALIVCPAAAARLLSDKFSHYFVLSAILGASAGMAGYYLGAILPMQMGYSFSLNAAGSIALSAVGIVFASFLYKRQRIT